MDVCAELQKYDWNQPRWTPDKLIACSPFRPERHPSFAVRLDNGIWIDSGSDDETWRKGNIVQLLSWLRNETEMETQAYLLSEYSVYTGIECKTLQLQLQLEAKRREPLSADVIAPFRYRHPYLSEKRGIDETVQRAFHIGYDRKQKAITMPWFNGRGQLVNIKFRSVASKRFWYYPGGQPIREHIYGAHQIAETRPARAVIVESEIDAMTLWQAGYAAMALGGANLSDKQRSLLIRLPVEELWIATDNDRAGKRIAHSIIQQLSGYKRLWMIELPQHAKDINELSTRELHDTIRNARKNTTIYTIGGLL
ncbi:Toprim domain-containing protein [Heliophilum fasciatum]|uniref:Toprim domain-containing protein n=1 Tax=Heliophilum fasciatum TaxID=35700 RepID=A0A4R2RN40_9FIRM|nr:Toprim domain-containing protein [Heliophilum fasciatum]